MTTPPRIFGKGLGHSKKFPTLGRLLRTFFTPRFCCTSKMKKVSIYAYMNIAYMHSICAGLWIGGLFNRRCRPSSLLLEIRYIQLSNFVPSWGWCSRQQKRWCKYSGSNQFKMAAFYMSFLHVTIGSVLPYDHESRNFMFYLSI